MNSLFQRMPRHLSIQMIIKRNVLPQPRYYSVINCVKFTSNTFVPTKVSFEQHSTVSSLKYYSSESKSSRNLLAMSDYIFEHLQNNQSIKQDKSVIAKLCKFLQDQDVDDDIIKNILCNVKNPSGFRLSQIEAVAEIFVDYNINTAKIFGDINFFESVSTMKPKYLQTKLIEFDQMKIGAVPFTVFIERAPIILLLSTQDLKRRLDLILGIFPPKEMRHLIKNSPNVLTDQWETTMEKITYVEQVMGLDQPHMSYNKTLSHSLSLIQNRFEVLKRLGRYEKPKLFRNRLSHLINDKMANILDTSDTYFCKFIARISPDEWYAFQELVRQERQESEDGILLDVDDDHALYLEEIEIKKKSFLKHLHDN